MIRLLFLPLLLLSTVSSQGYNPPGFKNWKCTLDLNHLGGDKSIYAALLESTCADLKDSLNQCCVNFNDCNKKKNVNCVEEHEECNAQVISGREKECSAITERFLRQDLRRLPDKDWKCHNSPMPGAWAHNYLALLSGSCANFKDRLNECCVSFNDCDSKNDQFNCVDLHEECNAKVISGRETGCSDIANRFIEQYKRRLPDNGWKCQPPKNRIGGWDEDYRTLIHNQYCANFKDRINQCCVNFNDCDKSNAYNCVEEHEKCNAKVISGQENDCSAIVDRFIRKDRRRLPDKDWKCHASPMLGALDENYRVLINSRFCSDLKDRLNDCCISFNDCDSKKGFNCVEKHEKCNDKVISGREKDCSAIADRFIEKYKRRLPDKDWKCQPPKGRLGGFGQDYRDLIQSHDCAGFKDGLNNCCVNFNSCRGNDRTGCVEQHKSCNSRVISGREKECSAIANKFIQEDQSDSYRVVIYFKQVVLYTKEQFNHRPIQSSVILSLLIFVSFGFVCGICCICGIVLCKSKPKEKSDHRHSSSRASSVRSSSDKN